MTHRLDKTRVADLHRVMTGYVERDEIPGIVTLVARGEDIAVDAVGNRTLGRQQPMRRDTIFRIASITKPIAAAAAMVLVDDGILRLDDPVEPWLPELADRRVLRRIDSPLDETVAAERSITVRDLLTSTFGFGSVLAAPGSYPIQKAIKERRLGGDGPPQYSLWPGPDEWMRRLGALPLMSQPGARWLYNTSSDVLGVLIARSSGKSFGTFLRERIFDPLGMKDTAFSVDRSNLDRLASLYQLNENTHELEPFDSIEHSEYGRRPSFESGSGGLVSTIDDYYAFSRMMLNEGAWGGARILSPASVNLMTRDQLVPSQRNGAELFFDTHSSWGFGLAVNIRQTQPWTVPGRFGWDGGFGTSAYSDPKNVSIGIIFTQRMMGSPESLAVFDDFWRHAYRCFDD